MEARSSEPLETLSFAARLIVVVPPSATMAVSARAVTTGMAALPSTLIMVVAPRLLGDLVQGRGEPAARAVYGDSAYGTGAHLAWLAQQQLTPMVKTQLPTAPGGRFAKDQFRIDLQAGTVTCPARVTVAIRPARRGGGRARFGRACSVCPLRSACTSSARGRVVAVHPQEAELTAARGRQRDPAWLADYRATRPKVERKLAHLLRRRHGGRRARVRGLVRVALDFKLLAAAVNLARLATLGLHSTADGWQVQSA